MPKQSNSFEKLVAHILQVMAPANCTVTPSAQVYDDSSGNLREVDVLIESKSEDDQGRVFVECRDRSRIDSVQWIDELIGKYADCENCLVIAVNERGFSEPARKKASNHGIDLLSTRQAFEHDWPSDAFRVGFDLVRQHWEPKSIKWDFDGERPQSLRPSDLVKGLESRGITTVDSLQRELLVERVHPRAQRHVDENGLSIFSDVSDFEKTLVVWHRVEFRSPLTVVVDGEEFDLIAMNFELHVTFERGATDESEHYLGGGLITRGTLAFEGEVAEQRFSLVQVPGTKKGRIVLEPSTVVRPDE